MTLHWVTHLALSVRKVVVCSIVSEQPADSVRGGQRKKVVAWLLVVHQRKQENHTGHTQPSKRRSSSQTR